MYFDFFICENKKNLRKTFVNVKTLQYVKILKNVKILKTLNIFCFSEPNNILCLVKKTP